MIRISNQSSNTNTRDVLSTNFSSSSFSDVLISSVSVRKSSSSSPLGVVLRLYTMTRVPEGPLMESN